MAATITPPQMTETEMLQRFLNPTEPDYSDAIHLTIEQMEQMSSPPVTPKADPRQEELPLIEEKVTPNEEKLCWKCSKCWRRRMQASSHVTGQGLREDHWMCLAIGEPVSLGSQVITDCSLFESRFPKLPPEPVREEVRGPIRPGSPLYNHLGYLAQAVREAEELEVGGFEAGALLIDKYKMGLPIYLDDVKAECNKLNKLTSLPRKVKELNRLVADSISQYEGYFTADHKILIETAKSLCRQFESGVSLNPDDVGTLALEIRRSDNQLSIKKGDDIVKQLSIENKKAKEEDTLDDLQEKSYQDSAINRMNKVTAQKISEESIIGDLQDNAIRELTKVAKRLMDYGLALNSDQVAYLQAAALFGAHYDEGEQLDVDEVNKLRDLILDECRKIQHEKDLREVFAAEQPVEEPKEADLVSKFLNHIETAVGGIEQAADVAKGVKALIQLFKGDK